MAIQRPWKSLTIKGDYPLLFLKARLEEEGCTLELTDLNRLWVGSLSRDELLQSARDQSTSIDPSEDDEQYEQFLSKVNSALDGEPKTSLRLDPGSVKDGLELSVSAPLPGSLPTFKWAIQLRRIDNDDGSVFESEILTPLLVHANKLMSQVQFLVTELGHKDRVIGKIADKLENVGQDLGQVFPGASNPRSAKAAKRAQLASHVEGLAEFDADKWQAAAIRDSGEEDLSVGIMNSILAKLPNAGLASAHKDTTGAWWRSRSTSMLTEGVENEHDIGSSTAGRSTRSNHQTHDEPAPAAQKSKEDDDFQKQLTPPPQPASDDDETEDEDDLDGPSQKASQVKPASQNGTDSSRTLSTGRASSLSQEATFGRVHNTGPSPKRQIGMVGGRRSAHSKTPDVESPPVKDEVLSSPPAKPTPGNRKLGVLGRKTRSSPAPGPESEPDEPEPEPEHEPSQISTPKRGKKFGTFGGKTRPSPSPKAEGSQISPGKRLGMFGGRSQHDAVGEEDAARAAPDSSQRAEGTKEASQVGHKAEDEERQPRARIKSEEEVEEQEREDSEERANQRREKLKRDIEEKSKGPVKKKRKF